MHANTALLIVVVALCLVATAFVGKMKKRSGNGPVPTKYKLVLSKNEQAMYWRLRETFPDLVLAQVAFSALITSAREHRNRYDRKVADFVLCDRSMKVVAVIELDDSSRANRGTQDAARSALLEAAGYVAALASRSWPLTPRGIDLALIESYSKNTHNSL